MRSIDDMRAIDDFESYQRLNTALKEVKTLIDFALENEANQLKYSALNKSSLLLLTSKFEVFVEDVIEEYIDKINQMNLNNNEISEYIKMKHTISKLRELNTTIEHEHKKDKSIQILKSIAKLWQDSVERFDSLEVSNKFSYGKHGANELQKAFNNIEITNVFETIILYSDSQESLLEEVNMIDFKTIFNNIVNLRNLITHQDITPNLTHRQIEGYTKNFDDFSKELCNYLSNSLDNIRRICYGIDEIIEELEEISR